MRDELGGLGNPHRLGQRLLSDVAPAVPGDEKRAEPRGWLLVLLSVLIAAGVYLGTLSGPFIWDDVILIADSPSIRSIDIARAFSEPFWSGPPGEVRSVAYFRPITALSFAVDYRLHGDNSAGYHVTNIVLHVLTIATLFGLLRKRGVTLLVSFLLTTLWALLPRLTENVAWVSGRADVLAGLFALLSVLLYLERPGSWLFRALAIALASVALLCKESGLGAFAALFVLMLGEWRAGQARSRASFAAEVSLLVLPLLGYAALRYAAGAFTLGDGLILTPLVRAATVLEAIGRYTWMLVDAFRPRSYVGVLGSVDYRFAALGAVVSIALARGAWRARRCSSLTLGFLALGLVPLGLVLHLTRLPLTVVAADRYLYLTTAALLVAFAPALQGWLASRRPLLLAVAVVTLALGARSHQRALDYADPARFWIAAARHAPAEASALVELGSVAFRAGCFEQAFELYRRAVALEDARSPTALENAALLAAILGHRKLAAQLGDALLEHFPDKPSLELRRASLALNALDFEVARVHGARALALNPDFEPARAFLGTVEKMRDIWPAVEAGSVPVGVGLMFELEVFRYPECIATLERLLEDPAADDATLQRAMEFLVARGKPRVVKELMGPYLARRSAPRAAELEEALALRLETADHVQSLLLEYERQRPLPTGSAR